MIKNPRQLAIEKKEVSDLAVLIKNMDLLSIEGRMDLVQQLQYDLYKSRQEELKSEIEEYEHLTSDNLEFLEFNSIKDDLKKAIISIRIASGLTQKDLADKLEIHEQQIQRYEQNDYLNASFERVIQILETLNVEINFRKVLKDKMRTSDLSKFSIPSECKEGLNKIIPFVTDRKQIVNW